MEYVPLIWLPSSDMAPVKSIVTVDPLLVMAIPKSTDPLPTLPVRLVLLLYEKVTLVKVMVPLNVVSLWARVPARVPSSRPSLLVQFPRHVPVRSPVTAAPLLPVPLLSLPPQPVTDSKPTSAATIANTLLTSTSIVGYIDVTLAVTITALDLTGKVKWCETVERVAPLAVRPRSHEQSAAATTLRPPRRRGSLWAELDETTAPARTHPIFAVVPRSGLLPRYQRSTTGVAIYMVE